MGKHDAYGHTLHISKKQRFNQPKPPNTNQKSTAPQLPAPGTNAYNQFR
jgi:hypothetical protein